MKARRRVLWGLLWTLGCGYPNHPHDLRVREELVDGPEFGLAVSESLGTPWEAGNTVGLVNNGAVLDLIVEEIGQARYSINILAALWRDSPPSDRVVAALRAKAQQGVRCRIVVDPLLSVEFTPVRMRLEDAGCEARDYRPFGPRSLWSLAHRHHGRFVVIDGREAVVGGFGIWRSWEGDGLTPEHWRDTSVRISGPVVHEIQQEFARVWQESGGQLLEEEEFPKLQSDGQASAAFVASRGDPGLSEAERMFQLMVAASHKRIWIANSYFIPSTALVDVLVLKAKEGVDVRVLVPGPLHDIPPVRHASQSTYDRLLENGVRIFEYMPAMMHSKTVLVDDRLVEVGSNNLDPLSLKLNGETALIIEDPALAGDLDAAMRVDFSHSREIIWENWRHRGLWDRFIQTLPALVGEYL